MMFLGVWTFCAVATHSNATKYQRGHWYTDRGLSICSLKWEWVRKKKCSQMHVLQDVGHSVANTEKKRRLGFYIVNHTLKKYVYYLFFFFFSPQEENLHKHRGTEEFWRLRHLSRAESLLSLKPVIHYTASCSLLQKAWFHETCLDSSFQYKELRETMCFSIPGTRAHGYMVRSGRKQGINDGRKLPIARW